MSEQRTAHTPGPWYVTDPNEGSGLLPSWEICNDEFDNPSGDDDAPVLHVVVEYGTKEDAHLIAAAPEMMEALEDAKRVIELIYPSSGYSDVPEVTLEKISAVLDKARGGGE